MAVLSLKVDPGVYSPSMARFKRGSLLDWLERPAYWADVIPPTQIDGLYVG